MIPNDKAEAIEYWEKKRILWNLLLVIPSVFSYWLASGVAVGIGDPASFGWIEVGVMFCSAAVAANICYSFAYVIEFWMQGLQSETAYREHGRSLLFGFGCLLGIGLAFVGGATIAYMQYTTY